MLKSISWQTFLTVTTVLLVTYYIAISLFFYTAAIRRFFERHSNNPGEKKILSENDPHDT